MSSPRPMAPSSGTPATSVAKRTHRVHWMQRFIERLDQRRRYTCPRPRACSRGSGSVDAVGHRLVLQVALAALVADRAVERMVDQQELHHPFARLAHHRRAWSSPPAARRWGRGGSRARPRRRTRPASAGRLHLDQAHAAIAGDRQPLVEAEARNLGARRLARLQKRVLRRDVDLLAVDEILLMRPVRPARRNRAVFHSCAAGTLSQPKAWSEGRCAVRYSSRSFAFLDGRPVAGRYPPHHEVRLPHLVEPFGAPAIKALVNGLPDETLERFDALPDRKFHGICGSS